jgi:hypothetical protein
MAEAVSRLSPSPSVLALADVQARDLGPDRARGLDRARALALLEAALLFSGADAARIEAARTAGLAAIGAAERLASEEPDPYERGARVLALVHAGLSRYDALESRIDRALLEGRYNCVGSSSLFAVLAAAAGLRVRGVTLEDHAYCYLLLDERRVEVETTIAGGYDAPARKTAAPFDDVSAEGLVALALRNRATLLERGGLWAEALGLAVDARAYVGDEPTMRTLEGRVHNTVASLLKSARYSEALALALAAVEAYGRRPALVELRGSARLAWLSDALRRAAPAEALALAEAELAAGEADAAWLERAFSFAYSSLAEERRRAGDHLGAWLAASEGADRFRDSASLASLSRTARSNWVKSAHNGFAALYNAGRYAEALALVRGALAAAPEERLLLDDERAAVAALGRAESP